MIKNERMKNSILIALADKEMMKVLDYTMIKSRSMSEIVRETNFPQSSTFRKIKWMLEEGLLTVDKINITKEGKKSQMFKSVLRSIDVKYDSGTVIVEVVQNVDLVEKMAEKLYSLNSG